MFPLRYDSLLYFKEYYSTCQNVAAVDHCVLELLSVLLECRFYETLETFDKDPLDKSFQLPLKKVEMPEK